MSKLIDFDGLMERTMDDREIALEILECYLDETKSCLEGLSRACSDADLSETREKAHEIKGSSASAGAMLMRDIAEKAQKESENGNLDIVKKLTKELEEAFTKTQVEIKEILS